MVAEEVTASLRVIVEDVGEATSPPSGPAFKHGANARLKMRNNVTEEPKLRFIIPLTSCGFARSPR
jgi:hypothetical protein